MICISIAQSSRRFALVDIHNASEQCDLLEVRLDCFEKTPEISAILEAKPKPMIMTCRRQRDGGAWTGSEEERQAILRQCIISKVDYIELELDIADKIPRFPPAKRVISYTNLRETPADIAEIYAKAQTLDPDVIKLTTLARTPEEAWPLVQILAKSPVPTVVVGLGKPGIMLSVLGKKINTPWTYAALEKGLESHEDQPTVGDLVDVYRYPDVERSTRFVGVTGFGRRQYATAAVLNTIFAHHSISARCLPLGVGSLRLFRKVIAAIKLAALIVDERNRDTLSELNDVQPPLPDWSNSPDILLHKGEKWHGYETSHLALLGALSMALQARFPGEKPMQGRIAALIGVNGTSRQLAKQLTENGVGVIVASHDKSAAKDLAQDVGCRFAQLEAVYSMMHDVVVLCTEESAEGGRTGLDYRGLKPGQVLLDLSGSSKAETLLTEAVSRGCSLVTPREIWLEQVFIQARMLTNKDVPREHVFETLPWLEDEV